MTDGPNSSGKHARYSVDGDVLTRNRDFCPKCGPGVFLAIHSNRTSCGRCGWTKKND